jgi:Lon protease-like protein
MPSISIDFGQPIAIFPLPNCVLLPHATIPLHIFEPRYRRMLSDVLRGDRVMAMALFAGDGWRQDYEGSPALRPTVCVGHVARDQLLPDGRSNILLQGVCRAAIVEEVPHRPYRKAMLRPLEESAPLEIDLSDTRAELDELLAGPLLRQLASVNSMHQWISGEVPTQALIDLAIMCLSDDTETRYRLLDEPSLHHRAQWLRRELRSTRRTLALAERLGPGTSPDGLPLN